MGKEFYFETDDRLDRKKYAEFLKTLLEHCDEYRREDSDGAYVIAIDSPWGTGKTRFAKMLRNYLENRTSKTPIEAPIDPSKGFLTVYYNAWDTDFSNDALEPLIYSLINSPELESELFEKQADEEIGNFIDSAKKVLKVIGLSAAHHFLGETVAKVLNDFNEENEKVKDELCNFEKRKNAIHEFKETLNLVIERTTSKKLVIIVDELDRCRPTFAIETLEIAKHLFSVSGLIFIFSLDIKQLSCSVKTIYGQDLDASGYLCRFFDYVGNIPSPNLQKFIRYLVLESDKNNIIRQAIDFGPRRMQPTDNFTNFVYDLATSNSLSFRDLTTIFNSFGILRKEYPNTTGYLPTLKLAFLLLFLKYKYPTGFSDILSDKKSNNSGEYLSKLVGISIDSILQIQLEALNSKKRMKDMNFLAFPYWETGFSVLEKFGAEKEGMSFHYTNTMEIEIYIIRKHVLDDLISEMISKKYDICFNFILTRYDLTNWRTIKNLTVSQYYYQQLEMFNFALPSEVSEA